MGATVVFGALVCGPAVGLRWPNPAPPATTSVDHFLLDENDVGWVKGTWAVGTWEANFESTGGWALDTRRGLVDSLGLAAVFLTVPAAVWVAGRRRAAVGRCARCGYDLRATPDRCPECGAVPATRG